MNLPDKPEKQTFMGVEVPEGTRAGMYDPSAFDGANAAKELIHQLYAGLETAELDEGLFRRDFLPILIGTVEMTNTLEVQFNNAWKAIAGSLQGSIRITRQGKYVYSVPPPISASSTVLSGGDSIGLNGIRMTVQSIVTQFQRVLNREARLEMYKQSVLSKMPAFVADPTYLEMWEIVLKENGIIKEELSSQSAKPGVTIDGFCEPGDEL